MASVDTPMNDSKDEDDVESMICAAVTKALSKAGPTKKVTIAAANAKSGKESSAKPDNGITVGSILKRARNGK